MDEFDWYWVRWFASQITLGVIAYFWLKLWRVL